MSDYKVILETSIQGIPCKVGVTYFFQKLPNYCEKFSDLDYYGYTEMSYEVLKMNDTPYPWLEKKMTSKDHGMVEDEISEYFDNLKELENYLED